MTTREALLQKRAELIERYTPEALDHMRTEGLEKLYKEHAAKESISDMDHLDFELMSQRISDLFEEIKAHMRILHAAPQETPENKLETLIKRADPQWLLNDKRAAYAQDAHIKPGTTSIDVSLTLTANMLGFTLNDIPEWNNNKKEEQEMS